MKFKKINLRHYSAYVITSISICITLGLLVAYLIFWAKNDNRISDLLSVLLGIFATISFGFAITLFFNLNNKRKLRNSTLANLKFSIASFLRGINWHESDAVAKISGLTSSFNDNDINIQNLLRNYVIFTTVYNNFDQYFKDDDMLKAELEYLLMNCYYNSTNNKIINYKKSINEWGELISNFETTINEMRRINIGEKVQIFNENEIHTFCDFYDAYSLFNFEDKHPYNIVQMISDLLPIAKKLSVNMTPYFKQKKFKDDIIRLVKTEDERDKIIEEWKTKV